MDIGDWLGDEPGRIVRRSRYARLRAWAILLAVATVLALVNFSVAIGAMRLLRPAVEDERRADERAEREGYMWVGGVRASRQMCFARAMAWAHAAAAVAAATALPLLRRARRREYHAMLRRLGDELGLAYEQHSRRNPLDRFAWELKGERDGREVKLARVPAGFMGAEGRFVGAVVISVACKPREPLSMFVGYRKDHVGAPMWTFPQPHLEGLGAWAADGELDPEAVGRLEAVEVLVLDRVRQAGVEVKEGRARVYYDLGSAALDFHPPFVARAVRAAIALAELAEG